MLDAFTAFLEPDLAPSGIEGPVSQVVLKAIGGGVWGVIQHEIAHGRSDSLPQMAPELTRIALAPFRKR